MKRLLFLFFATVLLVDLSFAQCESWVNRDIEEEAQNAHSVYRQSLKINDYKTAFEFWKIAYKLAPTADGNRDYHYWDGITLYKDLYDKETDKSKKEEYVKKILDLYDGMVNCYENKAITLEECSTDSCYNEMIGYVLGRKGYNMLYEYKRPNEEVYPALKNSILKSRDYLEYSTLVPFGYVLADLYKKGKVSKDEARELIVRADEIALYKVETSKEYSDYWKQSLDRMHYDLADVEKEVFDCNFFKKKLKPVFEKNKKDSKRIKNILITLKRQGCPDNDPFLMEVDREWKIYADEFNKNLTDSLERTNPALAGNRLMKEGKYQESAKKYQEAIDQETDPVKKAQYLYQLASIQFAHLGQYSTARANALKAAKLKPNWGKPYILIGDM